MAFDQHNVLPDASLAPYRTMDVVAFLLAIGSPRAHDMPEFAQCISESAKRHDVNPLWLICRAQLEQQFIMRPHGTNLPGASWARALSHTMGWGATDGGDLGGMDGVKRQVELAAAGIRKYLTPTHSLYAGRLIGKRVKCHDGTAVPTNIGTAALYQYTPDIEAARVFRQLYLQWEGAAARHTANETTGETPMATLDDVARIAEQAVDAHAKGATSVTIGGIVFNLRETGMCQRFVRQAHTVAMGLPENKPNNARSWEYSRDNARLAEVALKQGGTRISGPARGAIVAMNGTGHVNGHIGICLGDNWIAHNTSGAWSGLNNPRGTGTVATPLAAVAHIVTGYYAALPAGKQLRGLVMLPKSELRSVGAQLVDGVPYADLAQLVNLMASARGIDLRATTGADGRSLASIAQVAQAMGFGYSNRMSDQQKVYVWPPGVT